ncbi:MAG: hypothetical protein AAB214_11690, partial [Fibrobacterota bacterium]
CTGRLRAWMIVNDTIQGECTKVAVSDLEAGVGVSARGTRSNLRVASLVKGIRISTGANHGQKMTARLRDPSGRILSSVEFAAPEIVIPIEAHGFMLLEVETPGGTFRKTIAR